MSFFYLLLVTLERYPVPPFPELRVPPLSEQRVLQPNNCINTGGMSLFNLPSVTLERCPVPPLSELRVPSLSQLSTTY